MKVKVSEFLMHIFTNKNNFQENHVKLIDTFD